MRLSKEDIALLRKLDEAETVPALETASDTACDAATVTASGAGADQPTATAAAAAPVAAADQAPQSGSGTEPQEPPTAHLDVPRAMFEYSLVTRLPSGDLQLTKTGARALFQAECINALEMAAAGTAPDMTSGVERWLVSSGFMEACKRSVTRRGTLWLESLSPDPAGPASACPEQAASFAARRGAAQDLSR